MLQAAALETAFHSAVKNLSRSCKLRRAKGFFDGMQEAFLGKNLFSG
jgi:hypothetical protein